MDILQSRANEFMAAQGKTLCENGCADSCAQTLRGLTGWDINYCRQYADSYLTRLGHFVSSVLHMEKEVSPITQRTPYMPEGMTLHERAIQVT